MERGQAGDETSRVSTAQLVTCGGISLSYSLQHSRAPLANFLEVKPPITFMDLDLPRKTWTTVGEDKVIKVSP